MRSICLTLLVASLGLSAQAQKAVLIDETPVRSSGSNTGSVSGPSGRQKVETKNGSYLIQSHPINQMFREGNYSTIEAMRSDRRVGVGVETFGRLGIMGVDVELNYGPSDSATVGIGGGPGYNSVSFGGKHVFGGDLLAPYAGFSLTRWSGSSGSKFDGTSPAYLEDKFLTVNEKNTGRFAKNFLVPALGLQFNQLQGPSAGGVLFAEVVVMVDVSTMDYVPTGSLGAMYFF